MTALGKKIQIPIVPSVNPYDDSTETDTVFFTDMDKVRFQEGKLRKLGGWRRVFFNNFQRINGAARNVFFYRNAANNPITVIGTDRSLYVVLEDITLRNITPLQTTTNAIPDSLQTEYHSSVDVDVTTTENSSDVIVKIYNLLNSGDDLEISGVTGTINGIPASAFNNTFTATVKDTETVIIDVGTPATSSGTISVNMTWATSYVIANIANHNRVRGDRIKIQSSTDLGNIDASRINKELEITNCVDIGRFVFQTDTIATSLITSGGGGSTTIQYQIPPGNINPSVGYGYGGGQYGDGDYGTAKKFTNQAANTFPRIWSMGRWQNTSGDVKLILTPGDTEGSADGSGANMYAWSGDTDVAPTLINNAPKYVRWCYVSHNAVCTLGGAFSPATEGIPNFFAASDVEDMTIWTPSPSNYAFFATLDQASALLSQAAVRDSDLIYTENSTYRVIFADKPNIWHISKLFSSAGIMGAKARAEVEDAIIWMGQDDFFVYNNSSVVALPNNTVKRYIFDNMNYSMRYKNFAFHNSSFNEVWFFYCRGGDNEPNNYVIYNYANQNWMIGTMSRTAAQEYSSLSSAPYLVYSHQIGYLYPGAIQSFFITPDADPLTTTSASRSIVLTITTKCFLTTDDYIEIKGAVDTNGIPASEINAIHKIVSVSESTVTQYKKDITLVDVTTAASSTGSGGGTDVTVGTAVIGVDIQSSRIQINETVSLINAPAVGGIEEQYVNVNSVNVRTEIDGIVQINNVSPTLKFSTSAETISGLVKTQLEYHPSDRLLRHEVGVDEYNDSYNPNDPDSSPLQAMHAYAVTNMAMLGEGDETAVLYSVYPDTNQVGNLTLEVKGRLYSQSGLIYPTLGGYDGKYTITPQTTKVDIMFIARERQYKISSNELGGDFLIGKWFEEIKPSSTR